MHVLVTMRHGAAGALAPLLGKVTPLQGLGPRGFQPLVATSLQPQS